MKPKSEYVSSVFVPLEEVPETRSLFPDFIAETIFEYKTKDKMYIRIFFEIILSTLYFLIELTIN